MRVVLAGLALRSVQALLPAAGVPDFIAEAVSKAVGRQVDPEIGEVAYVRYRPTEECTVVWRFPIAPGRGFSFQAARSAMGVAPESSIGPRRPLLAAA